VRDEALGIRVCTVSEYCKAHLKGGREAWKLVPKGQGPVSMKPLRGRECSCVFYAAYWPVSMLFGSSQVIQILGSLATSLEKLVKQILTVGTLEAIWIADRVLDFARAQVTAAASAARASSNMLLGIVSYVSNVPGVRVAVSAIRRADPNSVLLFEVVLLGVVLAVCVAFLKALGQARTETAKRIGAGVLFICALAALSIAGLSYPKLHLWTDVSNLSSIPASPVAIRSGNPARLEIVVPRQSKEVAFVLSLRSTLQTSASPVVELATPSNVSGLPVSSSEWSAYGFRPDGSFPVSRLEFLLQSVRSPGEPVEVSVYDGDGQGPKGDPLFSGYVNPETASPYPGWVSVNPSSPLVIFSNRFAWIVLKSRDPSMYAWICSRETYGDSLVRRADKGWSYVEASPCVRVIVSDSFQEKLSVSVGTHNNVWTGSLSPDEMVAVDVSEAVSDYIAKSPENFKSVSIPVKLNSDTGAEVKIDVAKAEVSLPNSQVVPATGSVGFALLTSGVCVFGVRRLVSLSPRSSDARWDSVRHGEGFY